MPLRLAYLVSQYPAINHTYILREIRTLRTQGFDIEVFSVRSPDRPLEEFTSEEREEAQRTWVVLEAGILYFFKAHFATLGSRPRCYLRGLWAAVALGRLDLSAIFSNLVYFAEAVVAGRHITSRGFTHLHTHFSSTVALFLARVFPVTFSATIHGSAEFEDAAGFYLAQKVADARLLCTVSQYGRSQLMRASRPQHWHKIEVSPLGVDPELFAPRPHRQAPERFEILSVGQLAPAKGYPILIDSVSRLVQRGHTAIRLRIVGGGAERAPLERQIARLGLERNVEIQGPRSHELVRQIYAGTDLFVLASFAEGVPVVLMEAMAMEIPCLATWITGIPELIRHGEDGWLVPPSDPEVLAEAIAYLMANPEVRQRLGQAGRLRVEERYHLSKNTRRLGNIFTRWLPTGER